MKSLILSFCIAAILTYSGICFVIWGLDLSNLSNTTRGICIGIFMVVWWLIKACYDLKDEL